MLTAEKLNGFYGKKQVLFDIDLAIESRTIAAMIGPNGAGKSTLLRALFGLVPERQGRITLDGQDMSRARPAASIAAGIAFVPQGARVFRDLTVAENLRMGGFTLPTALLHERQSEVLKAFPILRERQRQKAGSLSGGERQMLAFAMALILRPRILLIDEPSIGLAPRLVTQIFDSIRSIRDTLGATVVVVEQQAQQVLRIADVVFVLRAGRLISHGPTENYRGDDVLRQIYLGTQEAASAPGGNVS
jgi:branched-chain amino acid transport system ATP-binding protein